MDKLTCIIVEDQPPAQRVLKKFITDSGLLEMKGTFSDAISAISYLNDEAVDLMFLDIHLPKLSGIDFLKTVRNRPSVILTTAFPEFALESYEYDVVDYLLKPFSFARFIKAVNKVRSNKITDDDTLSSDRIFIKSGFDHIAIETSDIDYIKSDNDYTEIHVGKEMFLANDSLRHWEETLEDQHFIRVHKSFLINSSKIKIVSSSQLTLVSGMEIPIGRAYKSNLSQFIS